MKKTFISLSLLITLGVVWGSGYVIAKYVMTNGVPPLGYSFWQSAGPAILLSFATLVYFRAIPFSRQYLIYYFICGLVGITIPNTNMYFAVPHLPSGILAIIVNTVPMFTYPLALLAKQESFSMQRIMGVMLTLFGIMCVIFPKATLPTMETFPWFFMALLTPLCFALCVIYVNAYRPPAKSALSLAAGMLMASTLLLLPSIFVSGQFYPLWPPFSLADWAILLEIVLSSLGYVLMFALLRRAGPVYYSLVGGVVVITGLLWGWLIFDEKIDLWLTGSVLLILLGIGLVSFYKVRSRS